MKKPILNRCLKVCSISDLVEISNILYSNFVPYRIEFDAMKVEGDICDGSEYIIDTDGDPLFATIYASFSSLEEGNRITTIMKRENLIARIDN